MLLPPPPTERAYADGGGLVVSRRLESVAVNPARDRARTNEHRRTLLPCRRLRSALQDIHIYIDPCNFFPASVMLVFESDIQLQKGRWDQWIYRLPARPPISISSFYLFSILLYRVNLGLGGQLSWQPPPPPPPLLPLPYRSTC